MVLDLRFSNTHTIQTHSNFAITDDINRTKYPVSVLFIFCPCEFHREGDRALSSKSSRFSKKKAGEPRTFAFAIWIVISDLHLNPNLIYLLHIVASQDRSCECPGCDAVVLSTDAEPRVR